MGKTISEKIIAKAAGVESVKAGDIVWANVDKAMMDDILGPRVEIAEKMEELGASVKSPEKVVIISDHYTPPANSRQADIVKFTREWAKEKGVRNYYEFIGPCHQIMVEEGHVVPGSLILGTDSHTCMGGALASFASGVGSTEMLGILVTGKTWLRVPETIKVTWSGKLTDGVMAKDVSLRTIGEIGHAGATYKTVEYHGNTVFEMPIDERLCLSNMAVEMGAKAGLISSDAKVKEFLRMNGVTTSYDDIVSDPDAVFCQTLDFNAEDLVPMVSRPHEVDNVCPVEEINEDVHIDQAYIGSCTGGRYHDLMEAARLLKGKKVKNGVRLLVSPASKKTWDRAAKDGLLATLSESGAIIMAPTCGVCVGLHSGILADGENCISSTNRNFLGRMGSKKAFVYLGSPLTTAAAAIEGKIVDPRKYL